MDYYPSSDRSGSLYSLLRVHSLATNGHLIFHSVPNCLSLSLECVQNNIVLLDDYIYGRKDEFASPIVIEKFKLIFFLVPGVAEETWIRLFRRMMGYQDWQTSSSQHGLVHLYDYDTSKASELMTDPTYTRALFVRDPKQRISTVYQNQKNIIAECCIPRTNDESCRKMLFGQFLDLIHVCDRPHWRPQGKRMEPKFFDRLNFVGHMVRLQGDARRLLESIGAWDQYGKQGWKGGGSRGVSIFSGVSEKSAAVSGSGMMKNYDFPGLWKCYGEIGVDYFYRSDYSNPKLNLTKSPGCNDILPRWKRKWDIK